MKKLLSYKFTPFLFTLFIIGIFYLLGSLPGKENTQEAAFTQSTVSVTPSPAPDRAAETSDLTLSVRNTSITIGEDKQAVIDKFGLPGRIDKTEYGFDYYIYNNDYSHMAFIAVQDNKVVGYYTDSADFNYQGVHRGNTVSQLNKALKQQFELSEAITYSNSTSTIKILMDTLESKTVTGIYILPKDASPKDYSKETVRGIEALLYDLTNSARAHNKLSPLSWSSSASLAARKHSNSMSVNNFIAHTDPERRSPGERLAAEGIAYVKCGENIIAGYDDAILSVHHLYNSKSQRGNLLSKTYRYTGDGFSYTKDSEHKTYLTQDFYR